MYLGYREVNASLVETAVHDLIERGLVRQAEILEITDRGREALHALAEQAADSSTRGSYTGMPRHSERMPEKGGLAKITS